MHQEQSLRASAASQKTSVLWAFCSPARKGSGFLRVEKPMTATKRRRGRAPNRAVRQNAKRTNLQTNCPGADEVQYFSREIARGRGRLASPLATARIHLCRSRYSKKGLGNEVCSWPAKERASRPRNLDDFLVRPLAPNCCVPSRKVRSGSTANRGDNLEYNRSWRPHGCLDRNFVRAEVFHDHAMRH